jgi:uncharacterized protein with HEPN domain
MKAKRDYRVYLEDIVSAIRLIGKYTAEGRGHFMSDSLVQDGVIRQISIIGEAAAKLPPSLRRRHGGIPWKKIIGMRNVLVHDYAETNLPTVWATIEEDLPELEHAVRAMLAEHERKAEHRGKAA